MSKTIMLEPGNTGLASSRRAIEKKVENLLEALSELNNFVAEGELVEDCFTFRMRLCDKLKSDGWQVTVPKNKYKVKAPKTR